ncbi:uncharacterized protein LOC111075183 [Drosophila obscura]|uniref:uncharacterized protein LOC111075183 n=1 Tax=Drosophila obscura TaxID=7282 RepID=UPI001BB0E068|nr:uncharacterized protein LOC111075183 [Drosophila obscura]
MLKTSLGDHEKRFCEFGSKKKNFACPYCPYKSAKSADSRRHLMNVHECHDEPVVISGSDSESSSSSVSSSSSDSTDDDDDDDEVYQDIKKLFWRRINAPGAPQFPLTGFVRFTIEKRNEMKRCQPGWHSRQREEWQRLSKERKAPYMEAAAKGRAEYKKKMFRFFRNNPQILKKELAKLKMPKMTKRKATATKRQNEHASDSDYDDIPDDPDDVPPSKVIRLGAAGKNKEPVASTSRRLSTESVPPLPLNTRRTPSSAYKNIMDYESDKICKQIRSRLARSIIKGNASNSETLLEECFKAETKLIQEESIEMKCFRVYVEERLQLVDRRPYEKYEKYFGTLDAE